MDAVLLDTSVVSLFHPKKKGHPLRDRYKALIAGRVPTLSFQSVAELWAWPEENNWGDRQKAGMEEYLKKFLVIPYDFELAKVWARVIAHCKKNGRRLEAGDAWVAATAVHRDIPLITHDGDHVGLEMPGLEVISHIISPRDQL